jgi:hypothetical protein
MPPWFGIYHAGRKVHRMKSIRSLVLVGAALACSGCAFSMFTSTHEHREETQAIQHKIDALEQRVSALEQGQPAIGPVDSSSSAITLPAGGIQRSDFEDTTPAAVKPKKKSSVKGQARASDSSNSD